MTEEIGNARSRLFRDRSFRWIAGGAIVSLFGDQFTLIALPWLVLKLTGDTLALGIVLVTMSIPRALFVLLGGAMVDRHSAKRVLIWSQCINGLLIGLLAALALTGNLAMWMVYGFALGIGIATAFAMPSWPAVVAQSLAAEQMPAANGILMSAGQIAAFSGPLLAGVMIALLGGGTDGVMRDTRGIGTAFACDFASFAFSAWALGRVTMRARPAAAAERAPVLKTVADGLRYFWSDASLRTFSLYAVAIVFFIVGPIQTAMPVLAEQLEGSSAAFGILASAFGAGGVAGMAFFGLKPHIRFRNIGTTMLLVDFTVGLMLLPMAAVSSVWQGAVILFAVGALCGFVQVMSINWMQRRVLPSMLGRAMSVFMFLMQSTPLISILACGWLMRSVPAGMLYCFSGLALVTTVLTAFAVSSMRTLTDLRPGSEVEA